MNTKIFLFAGEKSGDFHGAHLIQALKKNHPNLTLFGVGGSEMRSAGFDCLQRTEDFEVMGVSDVIWRIPNIIKRFKEIRTIILEEQPAAVILIDYPGFNLRLAKALRKRGYGGKIVQYVSPSFWAWGASRVQKMESTLDLLLSIYPFEAELLAQSPLAVEYVGNPAQESVANHPYCEEWKAMVGIPPGTEHLIALFPGSRKGEIIRNLPDQLEAARLYHEKHPNTVFAISCAHKEIIPIVHKVFRRTSLKLNRQVFLVPRAYSYELMRDSDAAIAKSGTVTLELALHNTPSVVMFRLTWLNYLYARFILRLNLPYYCLANILGKKEIFPELIAKGLSPKNLFKELDKLIDNPTPCLEDCRLVQDTLKNENTSQNASNAILSLL